MSERAGHPVGDGGTGVGEPGAPSWFSDETSLLGEVRKVVVTMGEAPVIPGYASLLRLKAGGQAVVYAATQMSTGRRVAVKVVRGGADDDEGGRARMRFAREIELAASLRHPHIVRVYDSGTTADGRVFLVMELIEGPGLEQFAEGKGPREVAALMATVAEAVGYAHQRGVIHRDLKPDNILIDAEGQPRVVDFGLARAEGRWSGGSGGPSGRSVTESGQFVGSVAWSSPEHSGAGGADAVDTRSDVYSLGVILYRLLTGAMPYDTSGSLSAAFANIAGAEPGAMGKCGGVSGEAIADDLKTITLTCLRKNPAERYATAVDVAKDLRQFLAGEPIEAQRESAWRAVNRRAKRFRAVLTVAGVALAVICGLLVWSLIEAGRADRARADAVAARAVAERREKQAGVVAQFLTTMLRASDPNRLKKESGGGGGRDVRVVDVLEKAAALIPEKFGGGEDDAVAASLHGAIGQSYRSLGQIDDAEKQFDAALVRAKQTGDEQIICDALWNRAALLGNTRGRNAEAEPLMREVVELRTKLKGPADRATLEARDAWATQLQGLGRFDEASEVFKQTLEQREKALNGVPPLPPDGDLVTSLNNYGTFLRSQGKNAEALGYFERAAQGAEAAFSPDHPAALIAWGNYANTLVREDRADEAVPILERVVAGQIKVNGPSHQHTAGALNQLAGALQYTKPPRKDEAVDAFRRCIAAAEKSGGLGPTARNTIAFRNNLAQCLSEMGRYDEAIVEQRACVEAIEKVRGLDHYDTHAMRGNLGKILLDAGRYEEAEQLILGAYEGLSRAYSPSHPEATSRAEDLVALYKKMGRHDDAAKWAALAAGK